MTIDEIKRQIFIDSEEVCGNTMIDIYQAQEYVEQAYNKAIDDFAESVKNLISDSSVIRFKDIEEIAEQLKAGVRNGAYNQQRNHDKGSYARG